MEGTVSFYLFLFIHWEGDEVNSCWNKQAHLVSWIISHYCSNEKSSWLFTEASLLYIPSHLGSLEIYMGWIALESCIYFSINHQKNISTLSGSYKQKKKKNPHSHKQMCIFHANVRETARNKFKLSWDKEVAGIQRKIDA